MVSSTRLPSARQYTASTGSSGFAGPLAACAALGAQIGVRCVSFILNETGAQAVARLPGSSYQQIVRSPSTQGPNATPVARKMGDSYCKRLGKSRPENDGKVQGKLPPRQQVA